MKALVRIWASLRRYAGYVRNSRGDLEAVYGPDAHQRRDPDNVGGNVAASMVNFRQ